MTIYAIVNHLLTHSSSCHVKEPVWSLISPAGILQGGNPYFVPDFASSFRATPAMAVRIGKLGKGIARRFVSRYVDAVAPATVFIAADRLRILRENGLPWISAISYDRCLAIGRFVQMEYDGIIRSECTLSLESEDLSCEVSCSTFCQDPALDMIVESISRDNTLKTGDILLIGISGEGPEVRPGLKARLKINGEDSIGFNIR